MLSPRRSGTPGPVASYDPRPARAGRGRSRGLRCSGTRSLRCRLPSRWSSIRSRWPRPTPSPAKPKAMSRTCGPARAKARRAGRRSRTRESRPSRPCARRSSSPGRAVSFSRNPWPGSISRSRTSPSRSTTGARGSRLRRPPNGPSSWRDSPAPIVAATSRRIRHGEIAALLVKTPRNSRPRGFSAPRPSWDSFSAVERHAGWLAETGCDP